MKIKKVKRPGWMTCLVSLAAVAFSMLIAFSDPIRSLELDLRDYRFRLRGPLDISDSPVLILAIDDQSDDSVPSRWPWPREYFARVIENLNRAGAAVIGVDVIFDQPDRFGPDSDARLAASLEKYPNVVLAGKVESRTGSFSSTSIRPPYDRFTETGCAWGLVSTEVDRDGIFRRYLLSQNHRDTTYLSFALEVLRLYRRLSPDSFREESARFIMGIDTIPKADAYSMLINYAGPAATFRTIPFDNVLDDQSFNLAFPYDINTFDDPGDSILGIPPGLLYSNVFKDKIVLIGATMMELQDYFPTPFLESYTEAGFVKKLTPGVEIHASALQTILSRRFLSEPPFLFELLLMVLLAMAAGFLTRRLPTLWASVLTLILAAGVLAAAFLLFVQARMFINCTMPLIAVLFSFIGNNLYQYVLSQKEKRMIQGAFAHYVPEKIVAEIISNPGMLTLGGEERRVTVLFSDIAGFTTLSESLPPSELVALLNEYLTVMCEVILARDGIIDKFEGDAIMAEFGVPIPTGNQAEQACTAALEMQNRLAALREKWKDEGKPLFEMRVGVNTGVAVVGNMGSKDVFDYTVIGDSVNLGARLEGANKFYGTAIMISEYTREELGDKFIVRMLDIIQVKGKELPVKVYELMGCEGIPSKAAGTKLVPLYEEGMSHYAKRNWRKAASCFSSCLEEAEQDIPSARMLQLCRSFMKKEPGPDWKPVTALDEK